MTDRSADDPDRADLPPYDQSAVARIARIVEIDNVELVGSHYEREDDGFELGPLPEEAPQILVGMEWHLEHPRLVVIPTFATAFDDDPQPYNIVARFRLTYLLEHDEEPDDADIEQFAHWNAMFNAWPYWREFVSSTVNRGQLPRFIVPVMGIPRASTLDPDG